MIQELLSCVSSLAWFGYLAGLIIFYGITIPTVIQAIGRKKKYATLPVMGIIVALCCCAVGFMWNADPDPNRSYHYPYAVMAFFCAILHAPNITFLCLLRAKNPFLIRVRNAAAICFVSFVMFIVSMIASVLPHFLAVLGPIFKG